MRKDVEVARTWLSIRVELVSGRGGEFWPRPGRVFAAARSHTFGQLADAIDAAFARWDVNHMHMFTLTDGTEITPLAQWDGGEPEGSRDSDTTKLGRLQPAEQFAYVFDFGDDWSHLCTVAAQRVDPLDELGIAPDAPLPYWGWGDLPDQYGRRWDNDDGETPEPKRPARLLADLPPILPWWGPRQRGR
jgi:Plasmid pRiA4b ORF-3-like protein